jgi:hypothetical protein
MDEEEMPLMGDLEKMSTEHLSSDVIEGEKQKLANQNNSGTVLGFFRR